MPPEMAGPAGQGGPERAGADEKPFSFRIHD